MDRIFFCEGKNDVALLRLFFEQLDRSYKRKEFIAEEVAHSRLQNNESAELQSFIEPYNPYDVLVKSENGKTDLVDMFVNVANFLSGQDLDIYVVIDLDADDLSGLIAHINEKMDGQYQGKSLQVSEPDHIRQTSNLVTCRHKLLDGSNPIDEFKLIAFDPELEELAGIADDEDDDMRDSKLERLLARTHIEDAFHETIV